MPHVFLEGKPLFLTWHLHDSLPQAFYPPPGKLNSGKAFVWIDRYGAAFFTTWRDEENHYPEAVRNLRRRQSAPSQTKTPNTAAAPANRASHISAPPS